MPSKARNEYLNALSDELSKRYDEAEEPRILACLDACLAVVEHAIDRFDDLDPLTVETQDLIDLIKGGR